MKARAAEGGRKLYKSVIVIWSEYDPSSVELSHLAREAENGDAYCSGFRSSLVKKADQDPDFVEGMHEFFQIPVKEA